MIIGFLGLGTMGYPMAGHIINAGHDLVVFNRTALRAKQWSSEYGGATLDSVAEMSICDLIITCVGNDDDVREIYFGENGILENAKPETILIDHTTTSATLAKELGSSAKAKKMSFLDAPVSGGEAGAINGALTAMIGGEENILADVSPILKTYSKSITHMGEVGNGQLCKMANQLCIAGVLQGLSEAIVLATHSGLNIAHVKEAISGGAAGSWQLSNRLDTMALKEFDFGFAINWMRKDLAFCLDESKKYGLTLTCAEHVDKEYAKLQERGMGRADTSALMNQFFVED